MPPVAIRLTASQAIVCRIAIGAKASHRANGDIDRGPIDIDPR